MNIELDEVVVQDVSDEALEQAAGGAQGGCLCSTHTSGVLIPTCKLAIADRVTHTHLGTQPRNQYEH